ncbi:DUF397 domain-containing protein [Saccharothrix coeruleofusca]|uniref:DUF397 domain-containing protein n=1 Tax=Saccharothrix coeruleofusca TaxID=33919 RepID=A0A918AJI5_9PSEU|nr:DUF397 domain-containing protein [Saccharothrix coeruleofusca]GGP46267.1 hypothetical protein GCM10010185_17410 [Saccharothrix coeruleofusca]
MGEAGLSGAPWRKSSYSGNGASCVEVAPVHGAVVARDSKNPTGPVLRFKSRRWVSFLHALENGAFGPQ